MQNKSNIIVSLLCLAIFVTGLTLFKPYLGGLKSSADGSDDCAWLLDGGNYGGDIDLEGMGWNFLICLELNDGDGNYESVNSHWNDYGFNGHTEPRSLSKN